MKKSPYLKKLIFGENKNEMKALGIIEKLNRFIPCNKVEIVAKNKKCEDEHFFKNGKEYSDPEKAAKDIELIEGCKGKKYF